MNKKFNQQAFNDFIIDQGILGFFEEPKTLASGQTSHFYLNWRLNDVFSLDVISNHVLDFVKDLEIEVDCFYGVAEGATRLANMSQVKLAQRSQNYGLGSHVLPMGRAKPKEHGDVKDRYFVGEPKGKTIILEDITTTAGSIIKKGIHPLQRKELDVEVIAAIALTDRGTIKGHTQRQIKTDTGVDYHSMSHAFDILPQACKKLNPSPLVIKTILKEFKDYGEDLRL